MVSWLFCFLCFTSFVFLAGSDIKDGPEIHALSGTPLIGHFRIDFGLFFKASPGLFICMVNAKKIKQNKKDEMRQTLMLEI